MSNAISLNLERPCPGCNSTKYTLFAPEFIKKDEISEFSYSSRKIPEFMRLKLVRCDVCSLIYAPVPTSKELLDRLYTNSSFETGSEELYAANTYLRILKPYIKNLNKNDAVLDVGAGKGSLLALLKKNGFKNVVGIEPSKASIENADLEVINDIRQGIFTSDIVKDVRPSLITSCMTLEHLHDPRFFLEQAHKIILPEGLIALVTHNHQALINKMLGLKSPIIDLEHLQLFSPKSLTMLLTNTGFTDISISSFYNTYPLRYWIKLLPLPMNFRKAIFRTIKSNFIGKISLSFPIGNILSIAKPIK
jgi:2-polyprenyl-3-methyl-5-hydroxy-6-metoxy-1,4-benzoquinol methylase